jgi:hypothetical protein
MCPVLELREEKRALMKVGGGKVDFFLIFFLTGSTSYLIGPRPWAGALLDVYAWYGVLCNFF